PGWSLVGEAGLFKDPISAHGITDALRDAEVLARALASGTTNALVDYQEQRDELGGDIFELSDDIASFAWDLRSVRLLHESLAKAMTAEVKAIAEWDRAAESRHESDARPPVLDPVLNPHELRDAGGVLTATQDRKVLVAS